MPSRFQGLSLLAVLLYVLWKYRDQQWIDAQRRIADRSRNNWWEGRR